MELVIIKFYEANAFTPIRVLNFKFGSRKPLLTGMAELAFGKFSEGQVKSKVFSVSAVILVLQRHPIPL